MDRADTLMVNELKNTLLIGLTVLTLAVSAWWLDPQASPAQQQVDPTTLPDPLIEVEEEPVPNAFEQQAPPTPRAAPPSLHHLLGMNSARARLGRAVPTGEGIPVGHVEFGKGQYLPNADAPQFGGVTFVERSGASQVSGHAFATARVIYGGSGLAPGVSVVHCFEAQDWMTDGYLNAGSTQPPAGGPMRVLTHSWVSDAPNAVDILRRIDWQVDMHDTIVCVGVNNNRATPVPYLLGTAYNVIAVGTTEAGGSSGGYTRIEVAGRSKPDLVGPRGLTSFTTPAVAACAARLLQAADEMTDHAHYAGKAEVIKAVLLAGANKPRYWQAQPGHPLDEHLGAGVVHFDNSLRIMQAGPPAPGSAPGSAPAPASDDADVEDDTGTVRLSNRMGWDFRAIGPNGKHTYTFHTQAPMGEASIVLAWHRRITGTHTDENEAGNSLWYGLPRLADLDLHLYITDERGEERELAVSDSKIDNVEHIYLKDLPPGRYRLEVTRPEEVHEEGWDYALAWRVELLDKPAAEDVEEEEIATDEHR